MRQLYYTAVAQILPSTYNATIISMYLCPTYYLLDEDDPNWSLEFAVGVLEKEWKNSRVGPPADRSQAF